MLYYTAIETLFPTTCGGGDLEAESFLVDSREDISAAIDALKTIVRLIENK